MMWSGWEGMGWGNIVMAVFMAVFWITVIVGIIFLVRALIARDRSGVSGGQSITPSAGVAPPAGPQRESVRILEERYARGDIDQEEFLRRRSDILSGGS